LIRKLYCHWGDEGDCEHLPRYAVVHRAGELEYCACHLPTEAIQRSPLLTEAIEYAAMENEKFQVDSEGNIRLEEGGEDEGA
jgi:hypothetical protein